MSDFGRKDISSKIESTLKPDSQKSTGEQFTDKITDKTDNLVGGNTSEDGKSWTQQASDAIFGEKK